ncbi:MAG: MgtC/SapB family protein [Bacilli bacterium]|nr:MgtC/SapB family protein [Bacilli bacterium]
MELDVFVYRIVACFVLSMLVGFERQYRHRMVGLRTNVLVSLGSFLFVTMSFGLPAENQDITRIAASVVSGIGFLGAGVILRDGKRVKGLNTAATLWCVSAIGVLTGCGMVIEAAIGTLLVLISNVILRILSLGIMNKVKKYQKEKCTIRISCDKKIEVIVRTSLSKSIENNGLFLESLERSEITEKEVKLKAIIITMRYEIVEDIVSNISAEPGVSSISFEHEKCYQNEEEDSDSDE